MLTWREAVLQALQRAAAQSGSRVVARRILEQHELPRIVQDTGSRGRTPAQTMSRVLQELRDDGVVAFTKAGSYLLLDMPLSAVEADYSAEVLDLALTAGKLQFPSVSTADVVGRARQRRGQTRLRRLALANYQHQCAVCDVQTGPLLVAAHIERWADNPGERGALDNVLCLCRFHDPLYEQGYFAVLDDYRVVRRTAASRTLRQLLDMPAFLRPAVYVPPHPHRLAAHRRRTAFE